MVVLTLNPSALVIILSWNYILAIHKIWIILRIIERLEDPGLQSDLAPYFPSTIDVGDGCWHQQSKDVTKSKSPTS